MSEGSVHMRSIDDTWVGYAPAPANDVSEDRTVRAVYDTAEDRTVLDRVHTDATAVERPVSYTAGEDTDHAVFTADMLEELRRRLREAEAREASGVRERPTPEAGLTRRETLPSSPGSDVAPALEEEDPLADLEIEVEEPRTLDELDEVLSALPEIEVALAPNSESNFYCGFDEEHPDGVFVATYQTLPVDTPVYVDVHLPAGYCFRTPAIVEWTRPPEAAEAGLPAGVGLKMCGLDHRMRRLIRSFARHRKPTFYVG